MGVAGTVSVTEAEAVPFSGGVIVSGSQSAQQVGNSGGQGFLEKIAVRRPKLVADGMGGSAATIGTGSKFRNRFWFLHLGPIPHGVPPLGCPPARVPNYDRLKIAPSKCRVSDKLFHDPGTHPIAALLSGASFEVGASTRGRVIAILLRVFNLKPRSVAGAMFLFVQQIRAVTNFFSLEAITVHLPLFEGVSGRERQALFPPFLIGQILGS